MKRLNKKTALWLGVLSMVCRLYAQSMVPVAILSFEDKGHGVKGEGEKVSEILFAELSMLPEFYLVEREDLYKALEEQKLGLTGMVKAGEAAELGQITGAKLLITGSVIEAGENKYVIAKIIGTETSRVLGASVKGSMKKTSAELTEDLAAEIAKTITERSEDLLPEERKMEDVIAEIADAVKGKNLPPLSISIEERHIGQQTVDPAAETEFQLMAIKSGFTVVEPGETAEGLIRITGEGFSEFAHRNGDLISVKARVEIKALDEENRVIAVGRQTRVVVDLSEQIAGKKALQVAAADLAERMLKELVDK